MKIETEDDVILVRRKVRDIAQTCGFDVFAASAITTASSELARNVWAHAGKGLAVVERVSDGDARRGVRVDFQDEGPGIGDVQRVLAGGYSTTNTMGLGLSGARRIVDDFAIDTAPGRGTKVTVVKWTPY